jgi:glycosyltransferase involved in cell wall biosynthesis
MTSPVRLAAVVVPARDEADLLPGALDAVGVAVALARARGVDVDVLVVADSCTDATESLAREAGVRVLAVAAGSVGLARATGFRYVLEQHPTVPRDRLWLATTDADSRVPPRWLVGHVDLADAGADLVVGTVEVDDWSAHPPYVEALWRAGYDPRDGHGHVHGANVGVRADAYLEVGGFPSLDRDEDVALVASLGHRRVVRTGSVPVITSARARSRASGGFADHLATLA